MSDVQVFLSKIGVYLIAQLEQLDEEPSCYLKNIYQITEDDDGVVLTKWPKYTSQNESLFFQEDFITVVEPSPSVLDKYKETIS
jgi:hypothetical protein